MFNSKEYKHQWYLKNKDRILSEKRQYSKDHKLQIIARVTKWQRENPKKVYAKSVRSLYKLAHGEYDELYRNQNGLCAICGCPPKEGQGLHVDHNHKTGKVRGLLCKNCNIGIGFLKDDELILEGAIKYLRESR